MVGRFIEFVENFPSLLTETWVPQNQLSLNARGKVRFDLRDPVGYNSLGGHYQNKFNRPALKKVACRVNRDLCFTCTHVQKKGKILLVRTSLESFELVFVGFCKKFVFTVLHNLTLLYIR